MLYLYWIVSDVVEARSFVMRIRTMLNRKIKLIWKEEGTRLVSAPPKFPPSSSAEAMGRARGNWNVSS